MHASSGMLVIGITGGVGSGKSALLHAIAEEYNCRILFTDDIANEVKEPGGLCYNRIISVLGKDILKEDGTIDRHRMAERIFSDDALLKEVNAILHPAVRDVVEDTIRAERAAGVTDYLFIEAALLIEEGYADIVDEMWYVYAPEEIRRARLKHARGYTDAKTDNIMRDQLSEAAFRAHSDVVIDNSGTLEDALRQVRERLSA